jgi:AraC-like DNA-binding protein
MRAGHSTRDVIVEVVRSTGAATPADAVRRKARAVLEQYCAVFGEPTMPLDIEALASFLGIARSDDAPAHSEDAELVPVANGRVAIRVNPDRPETRQRFSIAHEITHTFFPQYQTKTWCRTDARFRRRDNPDDLLEMLCDIGASELVMPVPWFANDASTVATGAALIELAKKYNTSREATLRRFADTSNRPVLAVFLSWRLKPSERRRLNPDQQNLFAVPEDALPRKKLRLDYSIPSQAALEAGHYLPPHKSVEHAGPLYEAAVGNPCEGEYSLDLGPAAGKYRIIAVPVWTADEDLGPNGENAVGAIIEPITRRTKQATTLGPRLF